MAEKEYLKEFEGMEVAARDSVLAYINDAYLRCKSCVGAQKQPYDDGLRTTYKKGWELSHGVDVTNDVSRATNLCGTPNLRKRIDAFFDLHCAYDCENALNNIGELREELFSVLIKKNGKCNEGTN